ncbi:hypothetical protein [Komagataeibacter sp. SM21]|uniref:hypothetical protein n=1 Tax=Komagataeibacter sp. SM21 TaxID=3242899 RepID=UPI003529B472
MTKTKLEIIGPYTPEHEGPFCTRDGKPVRVLCVDRINNIYPIVGLILDEGTEETETFTSEGRYFHEKVFSIKCDSRKDIMNAREVLPGDGE